MTLESKMMRQLSGDIISNLPRDAIDNILTRLPIREAARTCILSPRWRYMWANLPSLVFDHDTFTETTQKTQDGLLIAIHEVLLLKRVQIVKFALCLPGLKSCRQIHSFVSFLLRSCGLREFTLDILEGDDPYKVPPSLFSCLELTHVSLQLCVIEPPNQFKGFKKLVSLKISKCSILPDVLSGLISSCPLLEQLKVTNPTPVKGHIQISGPNLRDLHFTGQLASISFQHAPCLSSCALWLHDGLSPEGETTNVFQSLHNQLAVEYLDIDYYYAGYELVNSNSLPRALTTTLNQLKSLTVRRISFEVSYEVSLVLCLTRSSPNLTKIAILEVAGGVQGTDVDLEQISHLLDVPEWSEIYLNSLREVEVDQITGKEPELSFIQLLLAISPKLEKMTVTSNVSVAQQERLEISTKMTRFRRASPLAEVVYKY